MTFFRGKRFGHRTVRIPSRVHFVTSAKLVERQRAERAKLPVNSVKALGPTHILIEGKSPV